MHLKNELLIVFVFLYLKLHSFLSLARVILERKQHEFMSGINFHCLLITVIVLVIFFAFAIYSSLKFDSDQPLVLNSNEPKISVQEVDDALRIRRTVVDCFERASLPSLSEEERKRILHFVVVGGGPTGVEFAAELHDFVHEDLGKLYPTLKGHVKITLLEAADHILNM